MYRFILSLITLCLFALPLDAEPRIEHELTSAEKIDTEKLAWWPGGQTISNWDTANGLVIVGSHCISDGTDLSTYTFTDIPMGEESSDRKTILLIYTLDSAVTHGVSSATVGGVVTTEVIDEDGTGLPNTAVHIVDNPVGLSETVQITTTELMDGIGGLGMCAFSVTGAGGIYDSVVDDDTASGALILDMDVTYGGLVLAVCIANDTSGAFAETNLVSLGALEITSRTVERYFFRAAAEATNQTLRCDHSANVEDASGAAISLFPTNAFTAAPQLTFLQCASDDTNNSTYTFSSQNTGTVRDNRATLVGFVAEDDATVFSANTVTVGGDTAHKLAQSTEVATSAITGFYLLQSNPSGTSEDVVITFTEAITSVSICLWQVDGSSSSYADRVNDLLAVASGGVVTLTIDTYVKGVTIGICGNATNGTTSTWANATEVVDASSAEHHYTAAQLIEDTTAANDLGITCDPSGAGTTHGAAITLTVKGNPIANFVNCFGNTTDLQTGTFTNQSAPVPAADRYAVLGIGGMDAATSFDITSAAVEGNATTELLDIGPGATVAITGFHIVSYPNDTQADYTVTFSEVVSGWQICVWMVYGIESATQFSGGNNFQTSSANCSVNVNLPGLGSINLGVGLAAASTAAASTWVGAEERFDLANAEHGTTAADNFGWGAPTTPLTFSVDMAGTADMTCSLLSFR